jgi:hypothetical protein
VKSGPANSAGGFWNDLDALVKAQSWSSKLSHQAIVLIAAAPKWHELWNDQTPVSRIVQKDRRVLIEVCKHWGNPALKPLFLIAAERARN